MGVMKCQVIVSILSVLLNQATKNDELVTVENFTLVAQPFVEQLVLG